MKSMSAKSSADEDTLDTQRALLLGGHYPPHALPPAYAQPVHNPAEISAAPGGRGLFITPEALIRLQQGGQ